MIIATPTPHKVGGRYGPWQRTGAVPVLPNELVAVLMPKPAAEPQAGHTGAPPPPRTGATHTTSEIEAWARGGIDDEIDNVESDAGGVRNDQLNKRALRCFRLGLLAGFDLNDIARELFAAARIAGAVGPPHTDTEIRRTLRSARRAAIEDGPCDPPPRDNVTEVSWESFHRTRT